MAKENVGFVEQAYIDLNAFLRGELPGGALAALLNRQIEWDWNLGLIRPRETPERIRGAGELIAFLEQVRAAWSGLGVEPLEFTEAPDGRVLVFARQFRRDPGSDDQDSLCVFHLWTIQTGSVSRLEIFLDRDAALEAAGLQE